MYEYNGTYLTQDEIIMYLRKSRADDALLTVEEVLQKHEQMLDEWSERNLDGHVPQENRYREVVSGETIEDRPEVKEVLSRIESPRIKAVLVVEVQRLSRGDLEDAGRLIKLLRYTNTLVITPQKTYDLQNEYDRDFFERELKRGNEFLEYQKRILHRGMLASKQSGNFLGKTAPYGYNRIDVMDGKRKCPTLEINEDEANVVRMIFDWYVNEDLGHTRIANRLDKLGISSPTGGRWSKNALPDLIENVHYIGKIPLNKRKTVTSVNNGEIVKKSHRVSYGEYTVFEGKHPAIISEELFLAAQEKRGRNHKTQATKELRNPFAGLAKCKCGAALAYKAFNYKDKPSKPPRLTCTKERYCQYGSCRVDEFVPLVVDVLKENIADFEMKLKNNSVSKAEQHATIIKSLEKKLQELEEKELSLWDRLTDDKMPKAVFDKLNEKVVREIEETKEALCNAKESTPTVIDYEEKIEKFTNALQALQDDEKKPAEKNRLLKQCIDSIIYEREKPQRIKAESTKRVNIDGKRRRTNGLIQGGCWTSPPITLDVKLRV